MSTATITIKDSDDGQVLVSADFGDQLHDNSPAHNMIYSLLQSVLSTGKTVKAIEDTAGDLAGESAEPSKIIITH